MDDVLKKAIRGIALQNASEHEGKTRSETVISKILGARSDLRSKTKEIIPLISEVVSEINRLSVAEQKSELESNFPEILTTKPKQERIGLPPLEGAEMERL